MKKDTFWFKHDSGAGRCFKMRKMAHIYGHWGKGVYWDVIELLRDQSKYCFESDDSSLQLMADIIGCKDETKFVNWFKDCIKIGLFEVKNSKFFSPILCENMLKWDTSKENGGKGGRPTKPKPKPKLNLTHNLNDTTREEERREEKITASDLTAASNKKEVVEYEKRLSSIRERVFSFTSYPPDMLEKFLDYWTEKNEGGKKMRFEMQKVFDVSRRLKTWSGNNDKFKNTNQVAPTRQTPKLI